MDKKDKVLLLRIAWMINYEGISKNDKPIGGGAYIKDHGSGYEIYNFAKHRGYFYGGAAYKINLKRLGCSDEDEKIDGVTVIWVATNPDHGGQYIVGWYKNATIFREEKDPPKDSNWYSSKIPFSIKAPAKESKLLLPIDARIFEIPKATKGEPGFGQKNVWYADKEKDKPFVKRILKYIKTGIDTERITKIKKPGKKPIQVDTEKRKAVEDKAMEVVIKHYEGNYDIKDVSLEKKGWDLEATSGKITLYLEVKGLSGNQVNVEVTPNEYEKMKNKIYKNKRNYPLKCGKWVKLCRGRNITRKNIKKLQLSPNNK